MDFHNSINQISNLTKCAICLSTIRTCSTCPSCYSSYCYKCITGWMKKQEKCPNCRKDLNLRNLCQNKYMDELISSSLNLLNNFPNITKLPSFFQQICGSHNQRKEYYCVDCGSMFCSDCVIFTHNKDHQFLEKSDFEKEEVINLINHSVKLDNFFDFVIEKDKELENLIKNNQAQLKTKLEYLNKLTQALKIRYNLINKDLQSLRTTANEKMINLMEKKEEIKKLLKECINTKKNEQVNENIPNSSLASITSFNKIIDEEVSSLQIQINSSNKIMIVSPFLPTYDYWENEYTITNINKKNNTNIAFIDSPVTKINFLSWKIRVFPYMLDQSSLKAFVGIQVILVDGDPKETYNYSYRIKLIGNFNIVNKEAVGHFKLNVPEGFDHFYEVDNLERNGFISNNNLTVKFAIKPLNSNEFLKELNYYNVKNASEVN